jgi:hypothetical protein
LREKNCSKIREMMNISLKEDSRHLKKSEIKRPNNKKRKQMMMTKMTMGLFFGLVCLMISLLSDYDVRLLDSPLTK